MIASGFGVVLRSIGPKDLEMVRNWRNSDRVRKQMIYQEHICREDQVKWFDDMDTRWNVYMVVEHEGKPYGVCSGKDIDSEKETLEGEIFMGEVEPLEKSLRYAVSLPS